MNQPAGDASDAHGIDGEQSESPPPGPVQEHERIRTLDVLRGLAIFGIFVVNIVIFATPLEEWIEPQRMAAASISDQIVWAFMRACFEYKFVSLFSLLFGVGLIVQMKRAAARGTPFHGLYIWRMSLLAGIGLAHALLIWYGDILFMYAIVAMVMLMLCGLSARVLLGLGAIALVLGWLSVTAMVTLGMIFSPPAQGAQDNDEPAAIHSVMDEGDESQEEVPTETLLHAAEADANADDRMDRFRAAFQRGWGDPHGFGKAEIIAYQEGPFLAAFIVRAISYAGMLFFAVIFGGFGFRVVAMFLIGMAMMKLNFFDSSMRRWHRRLLVGGLVIGLPLELGLVAAYLHQGFDMTWLTASAESLHYLGSFALCMAYVGGICLLVSSGMLRRVQDALAAVGRMALTNYLMQSVIATFIFYWWGLGLFAQVSRTAQMGIVVIMLAAQIVISICWLKVFRFGPLEWLWRSLTYGQAQPLLRKATQE